MESGDEGAGEIGGGGCFCEERLTKDGRPLKSPLSLSGFLDTKEVRQRDVLYEREKVTYGPEMDGLGRRRNGEMTVR